MGHDQAVRLLLQVGADPALKNNQGKTAGDLARERNKPEVSRWFDQVELGPESGGGPEHGNQTTERWRSNNSYLLVQCL